MSLVTLLPVHADYPCILQPPPSEPNPPNGKPPQPIVKQPTPSHKMSLPPNVDQADATEAPQQQLSHPTMQLPPNTIMEPKAAFYNSTLVFDLRWRNKYELHVLTM